MSLESQISTLENSVQESYNVLEEKGSDIPAKATLANLAPAILGIPEPQKPQYGILSYYSVWNDTITLQDAMECVVNSFNETKLKAFADANGGFQEYMMFNYEEDWEQGGHRWVYQNPSSTVYIAEDDFLSTTGIDVTVTSEYGFANINFIRAMVVDTSSQVESAELTATDWATFDGGSDRNAYTVNNGAITVPRIAVKGFVFGEVPTIIGSYVLANCDNLTDVDMSYAKFTSTGTYFMAYLYSFNKPVTLPATLKSLGSQFLMGQEKSDMTTGEQIATPFNAKVNLPNGLTTIGNEFVANQKYYNKPVEVPETVTTIGSGFLSSDKAFNSSVTLPSTLTTIPGNFLSSCEAFNQIVNIPSTVTSIGYGFLFNNTKFNQPLTLPAGLTTIGGSFLSSCRVYNQPLTLPESLTTIGDNFMYSCVAFNQELVIPNSVTSIGKNFLQYSSAFNSPITFSTSLTSIGDNFLDYCVKFNQPLTLPNSLTTFGAYFLKDCWVFNKTITFSTNLTTIGNNFLKNCKVFNQPLNIPASVTKIDTSFLSDCVAFNSSVTLPEGLLTVGAYFMNNCSAFSQDIVLPSTVTFIGQWFMRSTDKMTKSVNFGALDPAILDSSYRQYNFCTQTNNVPAYTTGITIKGANRAAWLTALPNSTSFPYRKLIDGGE